MIRTGKFLSLAAACVAILASHALQAETRPAVSDVQLGHGGMLAGQVLNRQGQPLAGQEVTVQQGEKEIARTWTDAQGKFAVAGLNTGVHAVQVNGQSSVHRLWTAQVAPPAAQRGVMVVEETGAVRGQLGALGGLGGVGVTAAAAGAGYLLYDRVIDDDKKPAS